MVRNEMVLTRKEFVARMETLVQIGRVCNDHIIWEGEKGQKIRCEYFVYIANPIDTNNLATDPDSKRKIPFWDWVEENVVGHMSCYSSSINGEWWGFTHNDSVALWLLKWG